MKGCIISIVLEVLEDTDRWTIDFSEFRVLQQKQIIYM